MKTTELREELHHYIDQMDEQFLKALHAMLKEYSKGSYDLTEAQKRAVDKGVASLESGRSYSHEEVMKKKKAKYPDLHK